MKLTNNNQLTNLKDNNIIVINTIIELVQLIRLDCKRFYDFKTNT